MRFKRHLKLEFGLGQMDIAPIINIVLLLLVFFLLTSSFAVQSGIDINLPRSVTSEVLGKKNIIITLSSDNILYLSDKVTTLGQLKDALKNIDVSTASILIKADRRAYLGKLVEVWNICRGIGFNKVNIVTNQEIE